MFIGVILINTPKNKQLLTLWKSVILLQLKKGSVSVCDFYLGHFTCTTIHLLEFIIGLAGSIIFLRSLLQWGVQRLSQPKFYPTIYFQSTIHFQLQFNCTWSGSRRVIYYYGSITLPKLNCWGVYNNSKSKKINHLKKSSSFFFKRGVIKWNKVSNYIGLLAKTGLYQTTLSY